MATGYVSFSAKCEARADAWASSDGILVHLYMGSDGKDGVVAVNLTPESAHRLLVHLTSAVAQRGAES